MCTPTDNTCHGEQRREDFLRQPNHLVNKARIEIHIARNRLAIILHTAKHINGTLLEQFKESELAFFPFFAGKVAGKLLQQNGARVGNGIDGMSDTIYQAGLVIGFLVEHAGEVSINFIHVRPVLNVFLQMVEHIGNLDIGTSMKRPFQGTDTCRYRRVSIRPGRRSDAYGKSGVVTTTVLGLKNQQQVERAGIQFRVVLLQHIEEILGNGKVFLRMADMQ